MAKRTKTVETDLPFTVFSMEADYDYLLARWVHFAGGGFQFRAGFFAQLACEKYMKAITLQARKQYLETHRLLELADECSRLDPMFNHPEARKTLAKLDVFDQLGRYGAAANYDPYAKKSPQLETAGVRYWDQTYLHDLDRFVFNARSKLDFKSANFDDALTSILNRNDKSMFVSIWRGQPTLEVVLTRENRYFRPPETPVSS